MKLIKNKKGIVDDFGSLLAIGLIMVIIAIIILTYAGVQEKAYKQEPLIVSNLEDASYSTRILLDWEIEQGKKLKDTLIEHNREDNLDGFTQEVYKLLETQGIVTNNDWVIIVKSKQTQEPIAWDTHEEEKFTQLTTRRKDEARRNAYMSLPRIKMPDGERGIIEVIIKQVTQQDLDYYKKQNDMAELREYSPVIWKKWKW